MLSLATRMLASDLTWPERVAWNVLLCSLLATFTYILWSKRTSSTPRHHDDDPGKTVGTEGGVSRPRPSNALEGGAVVPQVKSVTIPEAFSRSTQKSDPDIHDDAPSLTATAPRRKLTRTDYTVGWICAISTEHVAAQAFLDEEHEGPEHLPDNDDNDYSLGRVGNHNIVIVVLPVWEYGIASAASLAKDLSRSFPNVRIGLMVGIGGGAPSRKHDIRLGDIVVSAPGEGEGGVFQYDFGKTIQGQSFHTTGSLNQPPRVLRTAVSGLRTQYEIEGHQIEKAITNVFTKKPRLRQKYQRPDPKSDRLYRAGVTHPANSGTSCEASCGNDPKKLIPRHSRTETEDYPAIHYGLIASQIA